MTTSAQKSMMELGSEFYSLMGNCIGLWADIEETLFKIFRSTLGCTAKRAAIVYYRSPTIDVRRSLTDELLRATVLPLRDPPNGGHEHPDTKAWIDLNKRMSDLLQIRNRIAHQPMGPRVQFADEGNGFRGMWFEIYMSQHEEMRKEQSPDPLKKEDLQKHIELVWQLKEDLAAFRHDKLAKYAGILP